jgi:tetratricopeptide (TPR) repeat protein
MAKGFEFSNAIPLYWYASAQLFLGMIYSEMGIFSKSKESLQNGISVLSDNDLNPSLANVGKIGLMRTKVMNKEKDIDWDFLSLAAINNKVKAWELLLFKYLGDIFRHIDDIHAPEAEQWYCRAIEAGEKNGNVADIGSTYASYAELFKRKGDRLKAKENLGKAIEILKECGADGWVEKYEKELAALS